MRAIDLFLLSAGPMLKIIVFCGVGAVLARRGIITSQGTALLSNLTKVVFLPGLMFTKVVRSIELSKLPEVWIVPAIAALCVVSGLLIGAVLARMVTARSHELSRIIMATAAIGNTGTIPLVFVAAICEDVRGPFHAIPECEDRGLALVMLGMWIGTMCQWSLGVYLLRHEDHHQHVQLVEMESQTTDSTKRLQFPVTDSSATPTSPLSDSPDSKTQTVVHLQAHNQPSWFKRNWPMLKQVFANPPVVAMLAGVIAISIPWLRDTLINPASALFLPFRCAETSGDALIPCMMLVLGAHLSHGPEPVAPTIVAVVGIVRLLVLPLISIGFVQLCRKFGLVTEDPLTLFVALLMGAVPSAINLSMISTLQHFQPKVVASILFYQYIAAIATMTLFLMLYIDILFPAKSVA
eukprot:c12107_g1_i6.p1 GENE.c12107_g1_i6~~c12107_g1_i6.p1  ORF type:complete len:418 (+),score=91.77 c12107_g1_i6:33-1256(+)